MDNASIRSMDQESSLAGSGLTVAGLTGLSRVFGLVRDIVFSYFFGASAITDAFIVAFRIPNFFRRLVAEGAFSQAFIPVLAESRENDSFDEQQLFVRTVAGNFALVLGVIVSIGVVAAPILIWCFTVGAWHDDEREFLATEMVRWMFPYLALIALTAFAGAILNTHEKFAVPAASPLLLNLSLITTTFLGATVFTTPIYALAIGVLVAGVLQLGAHIPTLYKLGYLNIPRINWQHPRVRIVLRRMGPSVYAASAGQINILVGTVVASQCLPGAVSWLYYADRLLELPIGVLAIALQTILLPALSRHVQQNDVESFRLSLNWGFSIGLLLGLPASVGLFYLSTPLISTIFYQGEFTARDLAMASIALKIFAIAVVPLILTRIAAPGFFAHGDTKKPFQYATVGIVVNIVISLGSFVWLDFVGIACATSIAAIVHVVLLMRGLHRRQLYTVQRAVKINALRAIAATAIMCVFLFFANPSTAFWTTESTILKIMGLIGLVGGGFVVYLVVAWVCGLRLAHLKRYG